MHISCLFSYLSECMTCIWWKEKLTHKIKLLKFINTIKKWYAQLFAERKKIIFKFQQINYGKQTIKIILALKKYNNV